MADKIALQLRIDEDTHKKVKYIAVSPMM